MIAVNFSVNHRQTTDQEETTYWFQLWVWFSLVSQISQEIPSEGTLIPSKNYTLANEAM